MDRPESPYDGFIMDHIRDARNFRALPAANRESTRTNPLCGDRVTVHLHLANGRVEEAAFQCECCGISMASASMMTDWASGRTVTEARRFVQEFIGRLSGHPGAASGKDSQMERALLAIVQKFPSRVGCAILPWTILESMLENME